MALIDRVKGILLTPRNEWGVIETEAATPGSLYREYVIPLAAIPAVAGFIGLSVIGISMLGASLKVPIGDGLFWAVVQYLGALIGVYVLALVIDALAPSFGGTKNRIQALKVAVYSSTASWIAGIFALIPGLAVLGLLGLYSLFLLYLGLPRLMKAPEDKATAYTGVVVVAALVIYFIVGTIASRLVGFGGWGLRPSFVPT